MPLGLSGSGLITGFDPTASGFGKVLQVVRATDTTNRSTTSTSKVDVTGVSVTITPQRNTSTVIVIAAFAAAQVATSGTNFQGQYIITDSSNNPLSGVEDSRIGLSGVTFSGQFNANQYLTIVGYATPATTSPVTYKLRFASSVSTTTTAVQGGGISTTQMYAIEVAA